MPGARGRRHRGRRPGDGDRVQRRQAGNRGRRRDLQPRSRQDHHVWLRRHHRDELDTDCGRVDGAMPPPAIARTARHARRPRQARRHGDLHPAPLVLDPGRSPVAAAGRDGISEADRPGTIVRDEGRSAARMAASRGSLEPGSIGSCRLLQPPPAAHAARRTVASVPEAPDPRADAAGQSAALHAVGGPRTRGEPGVSGTDQRTSRASRRIPGSALPVGATHRRHAVDAPDPPVAVGAGQRGHRGLRRGGIRSVRIPDPAPRIPRACDVMGEIAFWSTLALVFYGYSATRAR